MTRSLPWRGSPRRGSAPMGNVLSGTVTLLRLAAKLRRTMAMSSDWDRGLTPRGAGELTTPVRVEPGGRLSQGMAVEASILARLLGIRLLKLDAQIVVLPIEPPGPAPVVVPATVMSGSVEDAERELDRAYRTLSGSRRRSSQHSLP